MKLVVFGLLGAAALAGLLGAVASQLRYVLTERHLKVNLFGLCLRRIRLADIESVSKRQAHWAEKWYNTWRVRNRRLTLRRKSGLIKTVSISPKNPFVFKAELDRAMGRPTNAAEIELLPQIYRSAADIGALRLEEKHTG